MKIWNAVVGVVLALLTTRSQSETQPNAEPIMPDLKTMPEGIAWRGNIDATTVVEKDGAPAIEFTREDFNIVWLDGFEFADGVIEFDVKGKSEPPQGSFVGVAFRVVDEETYDAVYFRPFNFRALDPVRKSHAVQYVSAPLWPWHRLREERSGEFEKPIEPAPDGDAWFHVKVVVEGGQISVFVNNANQLSLHVAELSERRGGSVGLWCFGYGVVSNLEIRRGGG